MWVPYNPTGRRIWSCWVTNQPSISMIHHGSFTRAVKSDHPRMCAAERKFSSSLISHGCIIKGQVERSVLSPGVVVEENAVVRDSIILFDTIIGAGSVVDRAILDKEVVVGKNCQIGYGDDMTPNKLEPTRLNTGITLIGKRVHLPDNLKVGRNCKIGTDLHPGGLSVGHACQWRDD